MEINFINEHPSKDFKQESFFLLKLSNIFKQESFDKDLYMNIVFLDDDGLLAINREYLNHDYYTDIITFPIEETDELLEADIYISLDRVEDNAKEYAVSYEDELLRVVLHGALHLCGYMDKTEEEISIMRSKENYYMSL